MIEHLNKGIQSSCPVLHGHWNVSQCHRLCKIQKSSDHAQQLCHLIFRQIILGNNDVGFLYLSMRSILPCGQAHMRSSCVSAFKDNLGGSVSMYGIMQFILNSGIKALCCLSRSIIVYGSGIQISDLLIKHPLAGADFPHLLKLFLKVLFGKDTAIVFQPLLVHDPALNGIGVRDAVDPLAELHCAL